MLKKVKPETLQQGRISRSPARPRSNPQIAALGSLLHPVAFRVHECAELVRDRPPVRGPFRNLVRGSGEDFVPEKTVPVPAGSFVRRVATTPHYDGVISSIREPAVIAISGIGPIHYHLTDPSRWREV